MKRWGIPLCAFVLILFIFWISITQSLTVALSIQLTLISCFLVALVIVGIAYAKRGRPTTIEPLTVQ